MKATAKASSPNQSPSKRPPPKKAARTASPAGKASTNGGKRAKSTKPSSPGAKASGTLPRVATVGASASPFVGRKKESFSVTNQPKLKAGNVSKDLQSFGYRVLGPIAAGAFSTIVRAKHNESQSEVAIKTFAKCIGAQADEHARELEVLRAVSQDGGHPRVATLINEHASPQGAIHAVLVYCGGGSLHSHLSKLRNKRLAMEARQAVVITAQVASALAYLHGLGVAHRDIKPANVLSDGSSWRLCDFGFAVVCHDERLREVLGTPAYSAPELVAQHGYSGKAVDVWAFGVMLYEMLVGKLPFGGPPLADLHLRIKNGFRAALKSGLALWTQDVPMGARALICAMLSLEAEQRPHAADVLKHSWVTSHCDALGELLPSTASAGPGTAHAGLRDWYCDVAGKGCLRPSPPSASRPYDCTHRCWHSNGTYVVCEACYRAGRADHSMELQEVGSLDEAVSSSAVASPPKLALPPLNLVETITQMAGELSQRLFGKNEALATDPAEAPPPVSPVAEVREAEEDVEWSNAR